MEEDSLPPFVRLQEKKKQAKLMQKSLEMKEEVRKMGGCWGMAGSPRGFLEGSSSGVGSHVTLALVAARPSGRG